MSEAPLLPAGRADALRVGAIAVLIGNWHGHATVPSHGLYPHQWSWDSAFIVLGAQHWAPRRGAIELLSLFGGQWADGRVPHIVFDPAVADEAYFPGPSFWRSGERPGAPPVATSGIIQPPVHAVAAAGLIERLGGDGPAFGRRIYPHLVAQNRYLRERRTVPELGLAAIVHPWESGMDNCPAWDKPLAAVPADPSLLQTFTRRDLAHAGVGERPTDEDYARYIRLALAYRDHDYDDSWVRRAGEFVVVDPGFNALWAWSEHALAAIATRLGYDPSPHTAEAARITALLQDRLFEESTGLLHAVDARTGRVQPERTVGGLLALLLPGLAAEVVGALVRALEGEAFRAASPEVLGVASFDLADERYDPRRYWRGPTWLNTTWLVATGLRQHGFSALAGKLEADMLHLVETGGFQEYFNARTGAGHGTGDFGWSAALVLHLLSGGPHSGGGQSRMSR